MEERLYLCHCLTVFGEAVFCDRGLDVLGSGVQISKLAWTAFFQ